jgi:PAS domain S-box-containing protein
MTRPLLSFGREIIDSLRAGNVTASEDIASDRRVLPEHRAAFAELNIRAFVGAPIHRDGRWVSLLVLHHPEPRTWPADQRELLADVAERARLAVDNARLQREQSRSAERLRLAAAAAGLGAWEIDLTLPSPVNTLDAQTAALFGRTTMPQGGDGPLMVVGTGWAEWVHPEDRDRVVGEFAAALSGSEGEYRMEYRALWPDGETVRWLSALATVQRDEATGRPLRVIGMCRDITEEKGAAQKQRRFLREMLFGLTEGKLRLCDTLADLPSELPSAGDPVELTAATLQLLRRHVEGAAEELRFAKERTQDLMTAASEVAKNAVRHAGGGVGRVHSDPTTGLIQVWVRDAGSGIAEDNIHRAVEQGWTTGGFGAGFYLIRQTCDRVYLLTGPTGTTVVLEMDRIPPMPAWLGDVR